MRLVLIHIARGDSEHETFPLSQVLQRIHNGSQKIDCHVIVTNAQFLYSMLTALVIFSLLLLVLPFSCSLFSTIAEIGDDLDNKTLLRRERSVFSRKYNAGHLVQNCNDWLNGVWGGSVYVPIGICIANESVDKRRNSYRLEGVLDAMNGQLMFTKTVFTNANCTERLFRTSRVVLDSTTRNQMDVTTSVVANYHEIQLTKEPYILIK